MEIDLYAKPEPPKKRVIPVDPGKPWAAPQPVEPAPRPDLVVPGLDAPEDPTDPLAPLDPTVVVPVMSSDPLLKLPPEGMLRLVKQEEADRFCFPVHADDWRALGWQVVLPVSVEDGDGDGGGSTPAAATVTAITPDKPLTALGKNVLVTLTGTGFEVDGDVVVAGDSRKAAGDYTFISATSLSFHLDCSLVPESTQVPFVVLNSGGESATYHLLVGEKMLLPATPPTVTSIQPAAPLTAGGANVLVDLVGTDFEEAGDVVVWGDSQAAAGDYTFKSATEVSFHMDCSLIGHEVDVPFTVTNSVGASEEHLLHVGPQAAPAGHSETREVVDYTTMTKAEIQAHVQQHHGVSLESSLTKAEMVAEAERLDLESAGACEAQPESPADAEGGALPTIPDDLLA